ncbi:hypothetical protein [Kitasatospora sp. NPDC086791]|uniref:hypothetical protein n=1 Tax=Kitasatospora sp. NPDC086791 TaxID=3155178 RepID=UPI003420951D
MPKAGADPSAPAFGVPGDLGLRLTCAGDQGPDGTGIYVRATGVGDTLLSGARFRVEDWQEDG